MSKIDIAKAKAIQIRDEVEDGKNTANRVGEAILMSVEATEETMDSAVSSINVIKDANSVNLELSKGNGKKVVANMPAATETTAGVMLPTQVKQIAQNTASLAELGLMVEEVAQEISNHHPQTEEKGFFVTDSQNNVGMKYDDEGLDFAKISEHAIEILKKKELGGGTPNVVQTKESGFFVVDEGLNVGVRVDNDGVHAKNILEFEVINK